MTVWLNRAARLVATLYSPSGDAVQTWRRTVPAGTSTLRLFVPAAKVQPGMGTIVLRATSGGEVAQSTFPITLR
jgi:hypothetical protein